MNCKLEKLKVMSNPRVSGYKVSSIVKCGNNIYEGINVEITPQYNIHAEQSAIHNAIIHSERKIDEVYLQVPPCGHCRQFIRELDEEDDIKVIIKENEYYIKDLLPESFSQKEVLGDIKTPFKKESNSIKNLINGDIKETLDFIVLNEKEKSFSPYTNTKSGVLIITDNNIFRGRYIESSAFNMSILPIMGALSQMYISGSIESDVREIVLCSDKGKINHEKITKEILSYLNLDKKVRII